MAVLQNVEDPPSLLRPPPPGWQQALVAPGTLWTYYAYESYGDEVDWLTGQVRGRRLTWKRASFWLPAQKFMLMQLQRDNTWKCIQIIEGPREYISLDGADGDAVVLRLQAA